MSAAESIQAGGSVEVDDLVAVRVLYVFIDERADGFSWQVRAHELEAPIEVGTEVFRTDEEARAAGRAALDRVCRQFSRYTGTWRGQG